MNVEILYVKLIEIKKKNVIVIKIVNEKKSEQGGK